MDILGDTMGQAAMIPGMQQQQQQAMAGAMLPMLLSGGIPGKNMTAGMPDIPGMARPLGGDLEGKQREVFDYMLKKGVPYNHALGMISNIRAESAFNPEAVGDNGNAYGLFQHNGPRMQALFQATGTNRPSWQQQVDYALSEHDTQKYLSTGFKGPQDASMWFTEKWERPTNASAKARQRLKYIPMYADAHMSRDIRPKKPRGPYDDLPSIKAPTFKR